MAKITRKVQKIFGSTAGLNEISVFGSLAAASPAFTTDPDTIQSLANYLGGWYSGVLGSNSPAIEDMNALCYLFAYQLAYVMQTGIPEWNASTTYYIGSLATNSVGDIYVSITDNNLNNVLTNTTNWQVKASGGGANVVSINPATQSPYSMTAADKGKIFLVNTANGAMTFNLPAPALNFTFTVKDAAGLANTNAITLSRNGGVYNIEGVAASFTAESNWGVWNPASDGSNYFFI